MATTKTQANATLRGMCVWFSDEKGFGYIRPEAECACSHHASRQHVACAHCADQHPEDVFVHFSHIDANDAKRRKLLGGQIVEFEMGPCDRKKDQAVNVRVVNR